jgi:hypothetical protein
MGTRSTTLFVTKCRNTEKIQKLCKIYCHLDGYPDGYGLELANFLDTGILVNGIGYREDGKRQFNGMGCLAASVIAELKDGPGGIYLIPITQGGEEYNYTVIADETATDETRSIIIKVSDEKKKLFEGTPKEFIDKFGGEKK